MSSDVQVALIGAFPIMCGLIGAAFWKVFQYREQQRTQKAEALRQAKNEEIDTQKEMYERLLRSLRTDRNRWQIKAERTEQELRDCLERRRAS